MATQFHTIYSRGGVPPLFCRNVRSPFFLFSNEAPFRRKLLGRNCNSSVGIPRIKSVNEGAQSYLDMWKKAVDRERKSAEFERMAENSTDEQGKEESPEDLESKSREFQKLLEVSAEERDRIQRMQVIDRAAAAIAAARSLLKENLSSQNENGGDEIDDQQEGMPIGSPGGAPPGPSFWEWTPPPNASGDDIIISELEIKPAAQGSPFPAQSKPVLEQERGLDFLPIPFETSTLQSTSSLQLPPLQSLVDVQKVNVTEDNHELGIQFTSHAAEAADALKVSEASPEGINPDGSRWWKETGIEQRPDGVLCKWTLTRGVSADKTIEWENKYWEAADEFGYKELGSEKSGRDATGSVWREYWRESMMEKDGLVHFEKTADKWGKNIQGDEWQEKWWEHYDASGKAEKWAHKWCSIDPETPVEVGHAHVWHERWGEKYNGQGSSIKYTDKWAERFEGDGWSKWGDKWDENFDDNGHGVKQGETWWEGKYGDRWNRTWGEGHSGSGWVHKYGKSSSGEHWDTHIPQETWYERFPHFGFDHCFENSVRLREVEKPSEWEEKSE